MTILLLVQPVFGFVVPSPPSTPRLDTESSLLPLLQRSIHRRPTSSCLFALERAKEVYEKYSISDDGISSKDLANMLNSLDIDASQEEADALFRYLDTDGDGSITLEEFLPWYSETAEAASQVSSSFQSLLLGRRTVHQFDQTPVSDDVLERAIACAIAAPNRSQSEPWRFIQVGPETVLKFKALKESMEGGDDDESSTKKNKSDWTKIPGWCVVTSKLSDDPVEELDDFKSTSCAVQNFMLSMWSEGIGSKWTSGPVQKTQEFADLCGVDTQVERVAGCIWYGFATGGLKNADPKRRKKGVDNVLTTLP